MEYKILAFIVYILVIINVKSVYVFVICLVANVPVVETAVELPTVQLSAVKTKLKVVIILQLKYQPR